MFQVNRLSLLSYRGLLLAAGLFAFLPVTQALILTWNGGGADNNWNTSLNWGGAVPSAGDSLIFAGTTRLTSVNDLTADTVFAGLSFNSGAGAFTLSGNRLVLGGSLVNNSTSLQTLALDLSLNATQTVETAAGNITLSGVVSGNGGLLKTGAGTLTLSGTANNTFLGTTTVSAGTLHLDKTAGINALAGNLEITSGGKVTFARSNQLADTTVVTLGGAGSVFNGTGINAGMPGNLVETIAGVNMSGGTFNAGGGSNWTITGAGNFSGGADNTVFVGNSGARLSFGSLSLTNLTATAGGNVGMPNSFTLYGNSTTLSSITVGSGGLSLDGSRLNMRRGSTGNAGSRLLLNGDISVTGSTGSFITEDASGGSAGVVRIDLSGTTAAVDRIIDVGAGGASLTINVEIANGSSTQAGLTKTGNGTLTITGAHASTYTGTTRVNGGILSLNRNPGVNAVGADIVVNAGGTLTLAANEQIPDTAGITVSGGTISAWNRNETLAFYTQTSGGVTGAGNTGQVTITGTMTLGGGTTFTLNSSGANPAHFQAGTLLMTGSDLLLGGNNGAGNPRTAFTVGSGGLTMNGRTITLYRGNAGTVLNLLGNFTGTGSNVITAGVVGDVEPELNLGADTRTFDVTGGTTNISVGIVGAGGLTKTGNGILTFTGNLNNTYSGTTTVSGGTLSLNQTAGTHAVSGPLVVTTGGTLSLVADEQIADTTGITVSGGTIAALGRSETLAYYTQTSGGLSNSGNVGNLTVTGAVTLSGGNTMTINSSSVPAQWAFNSASLTGTGILIGANNGAGNGRTRLTLGAGGLTMSGRNITLNRGDAGAELYLLGDVTATGTSGILTASSGTVAPEIHLGSGSRMFQITSGTTTIGAAMYDTAAVEKTGAGTLVFELGNSYSGGTTVSAGNLRVSNGSGSATGSGLVTVASGAILSGTGRIAPAAGENITINGTASVGGSGALAGETLTLTTAGLGQVVIQGRVVIELFSGQDSGGSNGAAAADRLAVGGASGMVLGGSSVLQVTTSIPIDAANTAGWQVGTAWQVFDWSGLSGGVNGSFSNLGGAGPANYVNLPDLGPLGFFWDVSNLYTTGLIIVAVPEPSRLLLCLVGVVLLGGRRRR